MRIRLPKVKARKGRHRRPAGQSYAGRLPSRLGEPKEPKHGKAGIQGPEIRHRRGVPPPLARDIRTKQKYGAGGKPSRAREQLLDRMDRNPPRVPGIRQARMDDRPAERGRNYPPRHVDVKTGATLRRKPAVPEPTRSQLAARRSVRAAQGHPATTPHPKSAEGARARYKAVGTAARQPAQLRQPGGTPVTKPDPLPAGKRRAPEQLTGRSYAGEGFPSRFWRGNASKTGRAPR